MKLVEAILMATLMLTASALLLMLLIALFAFLVTHTNIIVGVVVLGIWLGLIAYHYQRI